MLKLSQQQYHSGNTLLSINGSLHDRALATTCRAKMTDLCSMIEFSNLECLNEQPKHAVANALKQGYREDAGLDLESDTDEQLLLNIPFMQKVKLQSITISGPSDTGPKVRSRARSMCMMAAHACGC